MDVGERHGFFMLSSTLIMKGANERRNPFCIKITILSLVSNMGKIQHYVKTWACDENVVITLSPNGRVCKSSSTSVSIFTRGALGLTCDGGELTHVVVEHSDARGDHDLPINWIDNSYPWRDNEATASDCTSRRNRLLILEDTPRRNRRLPLSCPPGNSVVQCNSGCDWIKYADFWKQKSAVMKRWPHDRAYISVMRRVRKPHRVNHVPLEIYFWGCQAVSMVPSKISHKP